MAILEENDILFAHKSLTLLPGLSESDRRVAGAIIDHFNKRTGQCDPSVERLATLLGINRATVLRATEKLHELGLIEKLSHGGKLNRARYVPNWERFHAVVADWDARMKTGAAPGTPADTSAPNVAMLRRTRSQDCDVQGRNIATQTLRRNLSKKPIEVERVDAQPEKPNAASVQQPQHGLRNGKARIGQRSFLLPFNGGRQVSHEDAARSAAERRWNAAVAALGVAVHGEVIDWMDPLRQEAATSAELKRKGGGIAYIVEGIQYQRIQAHG